MKLPFSRYQRKRLSQSAGVAVINYHSLGDVLTWSGSGESSLRLRRPPSCCVVTWQGERGKGEKEGELSRELVRVLISFTGAPPA